MFYQYDLLRDEHTLNRCHLSNYFHSVLLFSFHCCCFRYEFVPSRTTHLSLIRDPLTFLWNFQWLSDKYCITKKKCNQTRSKSYQLSIDTSLLHEFKMDSKRDNASQQSNAHGVKCFTDVCSHFNLLYLLLLNLLYFTWIYIYLVFSNIGTYS